MTARVDGGHIHFNLYAETDTNAEPKRFVITPTVPPSVVWRDAASRLEFFQFNGNVALLQYESQLGNRTRFELWHLSHPAVQLTLPDCDSFVTEVESRITSESGYLDWLLDTNSNSQYLVRRYASHNTTMFVLIFDGFTSSKYCHRISMPNQFFGVPVDGFIGGDEIHLRIIGSGKDAKTVLTAQSSQYKFYVYDLSNGQLVLNIPLTRSHINYDSLTYDFGSCHYIFPTNTLTDEDHMKGGVDVIRIEWNGENWTTCTTFACYPRLEEYSSMKLIKVTDTQTVWKVNDFNFEPHLVKTYCILCDYLLNDMDMAITRRFKEIII